ncbi:UNVERIFIED_ORG: hypothetical protein FHR35_006405 [Microbispora rosea subsp. rosea]
MVLSSPAVKGVPANARPVRVFRVCLVSSALRAARASEMAQAARVVGASRARCVVLVACAAYAVRL